MTRREMIIVFLVASCGLVGAIAIGHPGRSCVIAIASGDPGQILTFTKEGVPAWQNIMDQKELGK